MNLLIQIPQKIKNPLPSFESSFTVGITGVKIHNYLTTFDSLPQPLI